MKTIQQAVTFGVSPERLYDTYMDSKRHGAAIGSSASVSRKVGGTFSAFGGMLRGRILARVPGRMIVQTWRGSDWRKSEADSILILTFSKAPRGGRINLVHANISDRHYAGISRGWNKYYWKPWRAYLRRRGR
ncbi:MAG: SRPBCC domain-containing protein [Candidatus Rokubacteria bacterium]|nr:SRPBCC domain-containing protein [Candidatus Rokubacteria bacterium]